MLDKPFRFWYIRIVARKKRNMPETFSKEITFSGRTFSTSDIGTIREVTHDFPALSINELAKTICELLEWKRPNGGLKSHECRLFLERLQNQGLVCLPTLRNTAPHNPPRVEITAQSNPQPSLSGSVGQWTPLILHRVRADDHSRYSVWTQYIERYHYLGYRVPFGANMRYMVFSEKAPNQALACLLFSSPAWKMAPRDHWIDWSDTQRRQNLQYIVNNSRFLILPWVTINGLASKILSMCAQHLPGDWEATYGYRPLMLETLVDRSRFRGTCYRAANWIWLGSTQGRGRMDREHSAHGHSVKDIYIFPLHSQAVKRLHYATPPVCSTESGERL